MTNKGDMTAAEIPPMDVIAREFFNAEVARTLGDLPADGVDYLRRQYVENAQTNPWARVQLADWWIA